MEEEFRHSMKSEETCNQPQAGHNLVYLEEKVAILEKERSDAMKMIWYLCKKNGGSITVDMAAVSLVREDWELLRRDDPDHAHLSIIEARP